MGVVLREATDACHAVELASFLEAIDRTELGQAQRQLAVAAALGLINLNMVRAVHRLEQIRFLLVVPILDGLVLFLDRLRVAETGERNRHQAISVLLESILKQANKL